MTIPLWLPGLTIEVIKRFEGKSPHSRLVNSGTRGQGIKAKMYILRSQPGNFFKGVHSERRTSGESGMSLKNSPQKSASRNAKNKK